MVCAILSSGLVHVKGFAYQKNSPYSVDGGFPLAVNGPFNKYITVNRLRLKKNSPFSQYKIHVSSLGYLVHFKIYISVNSLITCLTAVLAKSSMIPSVI